jgi:S-adenosyl methyltransferase
MDETLRERTRMPATAARIYDYMLGGTHNFPADQEAARQLIEQFPVVPLAVQANRATLRRMVSYLGRVGVRQFLDIGSGMPTQSNVHQVAHGIAPGSRVVYVDIDPVAVSESLELLAGNDHAIAVLGDLRSPQAILDHPQVREVLDFDQPIALLLMGVLHFIADDTVAMPSVAHLVDALPPGSHLAISHLAVETMEVTRARDNSYEIVEDLYRRNTSTPLGARTREQINRFFERTALVEPGLVWMTEWRPAPDDPQDFADDPRRSGWWAGLGKIDT